MKELSYKHNYKLIPIPKSPKYPRSTRFTRASKPNYQSYSMDKILIFTKKINSRQSLLSSSREQLNSVLSRHRLLNDKVNSYTSEYFEYINFLMKFEEDYNAMELAAVKIQRFVREYLQRKKYEINLLEKQRKILEKNLKSLEIDSSYWFYYIGRVPKQSAIKIQRAYRRIKFLRKIRKLKHVYKTLKNVQKAATINKLHKIISFFACKSKIKLIKWSNFRKFRLIQICRKLAIIKIKILVKKEKINLKFMKSKIRKYRRNAILRSKELRKSKKVENNLVSKSSKEDSEINPDESVVSVNEPDKKTQIEELQLKKREKISMGYISYSIRRDKYKYFRRIKINSYNPDLKLSYDINIKPKSINYQENTLKFKILEKSSDSESFSRKKPRSVSKNYLNPTSSSQFRNFKPMVAEETKEISSEFKYKVKGKILLPTISHNYKIKKKLIKNDLEDKNKWNISPSIKMKYIPSINNYSYSPSREKLPSTPSPSFFKPLVNSRIFPIKSPKPLNIIKLAPDLSSTESFPNYFQNNTKQDINKIKGYLAHNINKDSD
jgi:IQ calmodulin-binding motif